MTMNPRSKVDFRVDTKSSDTPPPSTPEIKQLTTEADEAKRRRLTARDKEGRSKRDEGGGFVGWKGLCERSVKRERKKAFAETAMEEEEA